MNDVLIVLNPRRIPECLAAIEELDIPKVWVQNMYEADVERNWGDVLEQLDGFDWAWLISDDCVPTQDALDAVRELAGYHPVVTGYCNLDMTSDLVNVCRDPLGPQSTKDAFSFYTHDELRHWPSEALTTTFVGFALTGMSVDFWAKYPYRLEPEGWSADYNLSKRLAADNIRMVCHRDAFVLHVKERWSAPDQDPVKRLRIGELPAGIVYEAAPA